MSHKSHKCCDPAGGPLQVQSPPFHRRTANIISTAEDYDVHPTNEQVHVFAGAAGTTGATGPINIFLNPEPLIGEEVKIVAVNVDVTVQGNGNALAGQAFIPAGNAVEYTFAGNGVPNNNCEPGTWIPECCSGATGATGATG